MTPKKTATSFNELPDILKMEVPGGDQIRCPHFNPKKPGICNKLLCKGKASIEPQEFKCPNCGNKTIFQLAV